MKSITFAKHNCTKSILMKKITSLYSVALFMPFSFSQTIITLQPDAANGKDAEIASCVSCGYSNQNFGNSNDYSAIAWTNNGAISTGRGLIEFDLTGVPPSATLISAKLSLYHNPSGSNGTNSSMSGSNTGFLEKIVQAWDENTVTWDNQPSTSTTGQISIQQSTAIDEDYLDIDITAMVIDMIDNPTQNFGFMFKLQTETAYRRLIFSSSDHSNSALHPKLVLTYSGTTGLDEHNDIALVEVYPNPTNDILYLKNVKLKDELTTVQIINELGEIVLSLNTLSEDNSINVANLSKGIYTVKSNDQMIRFVKL